MAYVAPNSTCEFFSNLGLNDNYDDSLYFASTSAKDTYFSNLTKLATATAMTYTREQRNFVRVELPMSTLISASYMRFKNTSFENKWFYAFVNNVEYINNNCTQVNFQIDPMMTWMGAFTLNQCYIERQHVLNDSIGANIADEGINVGEYVCEGTSVTAFFGSYRIALYKTYNPDKDGTGVFPIKQGIYVPLVITYYNLNTAGVDQLQQRVDELTTDNRADEILTMKLVPEHYADLADSFGENIPTDTFSVTKPYSSIGGYVPRNKKLFVYPYKYLSVENCESEPVAYKYEYFETLPDATSSGEAYFTIKGTAVTPEINIMCIPRNYNGMLLDYEHASCMQNFPSIAWNVDGYKAYLAQRDSTIFGNFVASTLTGGASGAVSGAAHRGLNGAVMGGITGLVQGALSGASPLISDVVNDMASGILPARFPMQQRGLVSSNLMVQSREKNFYFRRMCITSNYAQMLDSYFDMFGYAVKQHGIPNMNARPYWTYVKTKGCSVDGAIPADDATAIENIFNNGVRFWKNHNNIGNYSLNNAPV